MTVPHIHRTGLVRREFLQVGFSAFLGLGTPGLLASKASAKGASGGKTPLKPRIKSMILVFLTGGPSHHETFDPKPDAADAIRGDFKPIATKIPGVYFGEHLPMLAERSDKLAVVRSMSHEYRNHLNGTHEILTGHSQPGAFFDKIASRDDYPCYASGLEYLRPNSEGLPRGVMLPTFLIEGPLTWPGQHAGFLGPKYDPWQIKQDPNRPNFKVESLSLPDGFTVERLKGRRDLLNDFAADRDTIAAWGNAGGEKDSLSTQRELAFSLLLSGKVADAFDLTREDPKLRDRYGRHMFGQSLLLARKLVQAGVSVVQVNMGRVQTWDSHGNIFDRLKNDLLPPTDRGVSALLDDLELHGLLDETLVVISGEFGRTPKLSKQNANEKPGRDHWSKVFSAVFAGGGVRGGRVIGQSDAIGAYPASRPYTPGDLGATIYRSFGVDPETEIRDRLGRPLKLAGGEEIAPLFDSSLS
jgi:uncharacterized protein (DUF1501 family)